MFEDFTQVLADIFDPQGERRCSTKVIIAEDTAIVPDVQVHVEPGDELRRVLPNGKQEVFAIENTHFIDGLHGAVPPHYQLKLHRKGAFSVGKVGHQFNISGMNARVNLHSEDRSVNVVVDQPTLEKLTNTIGASVSNELEREHLLALVAEMKSAKSKTDLASAYQRLISSAANHMTLLAPFLPALAMMLNG